MGQKFYARPNDTFTWPNGAIGHRSGSQFDCLGPYAKVRNCPIDAGPGAKQVRLTCYATGYADTMFSVPACTRYRGMHVRGYFSLDNGDITFNVMDSHKALFAWGAAIPTKATRFFHKAAARVPGCSVDVDRSFGTVCITRPKLSDIFMQGDDAERFIAEVDNLRKHYPSLNGDVAELCVAAPYIETLD